VEVEASGDATDDQPVSARAQGRTEGPEVHRTFVEAGFCATILLWLLVRVVRDGAFATDFRYAFWPAGRHVLNGTSPFPHVIDFDRLPFVYPAPAALLFAPFAALPRPFADALFTALLAAALVLTLRLCRLRDPRCYVLAFLWAPVFSALQTANLTLLLALGLAAVWRLERKPFLAAAVAAVLIALKVFLWPVLIWLAVRRGVRTAAAAIVMTIALTVVSWWAIGFAGFRQYPHLMQLINREEAPRSYSLAALGMRLGAGQTLATALAFGVALAILLLAVALAREGDGRRSFALTVAAIVLCSPVVWLHYFALLVVTVALLSPRLGPVWFMPLLLWPCPVMLFAPTFWPVAPLATFGCVIGATLIRRSTPSPKTAARLRPGIATTLRS
jgi:hypothetical protein